MASGVSLSSLSPAELAELINAVPVELNGIAPIARAISTAGGIAFDELDADFMIRRLPGIFAAGEMLDWEAPTGGYLLQASLCDGRRGGQGCVEVARIVGWVERSETHRSRMRTSDGLSLRSTHPTSLLPQLPPRRDRQHADDLVAAHHHHLVHHVDDDADVVGHDAHDVADIGAGVAAGEIEKAVLLGEARDLGFGMFEDQAVAVEAAAGIRRQRLGAGIENAAIGRRRG